MVKRQHKKPPVVILGGSSNALSIARSLGRRGVDIYLSVVDKNCASYTRYCKKLFPIADKKKVGDFWHDLLLSGQNNELHGSIIFPCNDDGIEFVATQRAELEKHYILDESVPEMMFTMLNKRKTLELAKSLGMPIPQYAAIECPNDAASIYGDLQFPLIVKPQHSHLFQKAFNGEKLFLVNTKTELHQRLEQVFKHDLKVILSEMIPGPDTQLSSYYTYINRDGNLLFHFTKKVIRRYPKNNGQGTYHITEWDEETAAIGRKLFVESGFRGLGNVEFKKDLRDGQLKIIECNPRFTAAHELLVRCGMDTSLIIYNHLAGLPLPRIDGYREGVTLWFPHRDYSAYRELKALNEITFSEWIKSISHRQVMPHFRWIDPMPTIVPFLHSVKGKLLG